MNFSVEKSLNANLKNIYVDGVALAGFDPNVMMYRYVLAENMVSCPILKAEGYPGQTITTTQPKFVGEAKIEVISETGAKNIYTIEFVRNMSNNCLLKNMMVNGKDFGFDPAVNEYTITLPEGTVVVPTVTFSKGEEKQTVQVISGGLNGTTEVVVIAEDGTSNVYEIHFSVAQSAQVQLNGIYVDGVALAGFDPNVMMYRYVLAENM
ncbi:MAG: cadherin-like beta sandwich domain-containing protein, partial [Paludibacteraceae bacterium]|nr:cadherin-like beta sandwich domain-containing protein [Paludibacteraceae bacterium]